MSSPTADAAPLVRSAFERASRLLEAPRLSPARAEARVRRWAWAVEGGSADRPEPFFREREWRKSRARLHDGLPRSPSSTGRRTALRLVREWAEKHRDELHANWELVQVPAQPQPIDPLKLAALPCAELERLLALAMTEIIESRADAEREIARSARRMSKRA